MTRDDDEEVQADLQHASLASKLNFRRGSREDRMTDNLEQKNQQPEQVQLPLKMFTPPTLGEGIISNRGVCYIIGKELGRGSFGVVYEATDDWGNTLAAKVLLPREKPYELIQGNWLQEIKSLLTLRHPNITFIYDAFEYRDTFYLSLIHI